MKNKMLTYFLGIVVAVIWGTIIYWLTSATSSSDNLPETAATTIIKEPYNDYAIPKDTSHLLLNYRDPFGLNTFKDTSKVLIREKRAHVTAKPVINWDFIKYAGYMHNPGSKILIAILTINGKPANMSEGETIDKVKLLQNKLDSVKVLFNGKTKFIAIH